MKRRKLISVLLTATMMATMFAGCGSDAASTDAEGKADSADSTEAGGVKEFTAFFAVPGSEINDDNEIQQIIAEQDGGKSKGDMADRTDSGGSRRYDDYRGRAAGFYRRGKRTVTAL